MSPDPPGGKPTSGRRRLPRPGSRALRPLAAYAVACAAAGAALLLCLLLGSRIAPNQFFVFLGAVAVAAWYGGFGPGVAAGVLAVLASAYFFLAPIHSIRVDAPTDLLKLGIFAGLSWLVSALNGALRAARAAAEERAEEATRLALQLQEQAVELEHQADELQSLNAELELQVEEAAELRAGLEDANARLREAVDEQERALEALREAEAHERFLAEAGGVLGSSLDYERTLAELTRFAVPAFADYCSVDVLTPTGEIRRVAAAHADPAKEEVLREVWRRWPYAAEDRVGVPEVLRNGAPVLLPEIADEAGAAFARDEEHLRLLRYLNARSFLSVPLVARGRVLGALSFVHSDSGRRYRAGHLRTAQELARRAAAAIDNALLFAATVEASQAKTDFLAVMSHELRTPLNAIIGYADLFLLGLPAPLPDPLRPQVERIGAAARHLLGLIEEILTFSRLEAGREEARPERVDAAVLAEEAAALVEPLALERGLGFRVEVPRPAPVLETDPGKARQVLANLLGNAVKFTAEGEVVLRVEERGGEVRFAVLDTGPGIAPEHRERIFEPFWQVDQTVSREAGGTGLGLGVARRLARLLGGDVGVESEPGRGSTFTLRLPAGPPPGA